MKMCRSQLFRTLEHVSMPGDYYAEGSWVICRKENKIPVKGFAIRSHTHIFHINTPFSSCIGNSHRDYLVTCGSLSLADKHISLHDLGKMDALINIPAMVMCPGTLGKGMTDASSETYKTQLIRNSSRSF